MQTPNLDPFSPSHAPAAPMPVSPPAGSAGECRSCIWLRRLSAGCLSVVLFLFCLFLYTRSNSFTYRWHPDEPQKAPQVFGAERNYKHPMLLLEATERVCVWTDVKKDNPQGIVEAGRLVSAGCAAVAVVTLALTGYWIAGLWGFVAAGLAAAFCPSLLVYAHYMKEDTVLVMGLCLTVLGTRIFWDTRRPVPRALALVFLGGACGIAASGKYSGIYALIVAAPLILIAPPYRWFSPMVRIFTVAVAFVVVFSAINYRIFETPFRVGRVFDGTLVKEKFKDAFHGEQTHGVTDHYGLSMKRPNTYFVDVVRQECMPQVLALAGLAVVLAVGLIVRNGPWDLFAILFTGGYLATISFCVIPQNRYALPVVVLVHFLMALGVLRLAMLLKKWAWLRVGLPAALVVLIGATQAPRCFDFLHQFQDDGRAKLIEWVAKNMRSGEIIGTDNWTELRQARGGGMAGFPRVAIRSARYAAELGSLSALRRDGYKYIAVSEIAYGRFFDPRVFAADHSEAAKHPALHWPEGEIISPAKFENIRRWYEELFQTGELVWENVPAHPTRAFTNPTLRVYRLRTPVISIQPAKAPTLTPTAPQPAASQPTSRRVTGE